MTLLLESPSAVVRLLNISFPVSSVAMVAVAGMICRKQISAVSAIRLMLIILTLTNLIKKL